MKKTNNYDQFKVMEGNRGIQRSHLKRLVANISRHNMLEHYPIVVNEKMEVVDGQHRLKAAEILEVPVYYTVTYATSIDLAKNNEAQRSWSLNNWVDYYVAQGNNDYLILKEFMSKFNLTATISAYLLGGMRAQRY